MAEEMQEAIQTDDDQTESIEALEGDQETDDDQSAEGDEGAARKAPQWDADAEEEARLFGWKPRDEWNGTVPKNFKDDPGEYLERVRNSKVFRVTQEQADERIRRIESALESAHRRDLEKQRETFEQKWRDLEAQKRSAAEVADTDAYDRAWQAQQNLERERPQQQVPQQEDPRAIEDARAVEAYSKSDQGKWMSDPVLRQAGAEIIDKTPGAGLLPALEQIEFAKRKLQAEFPDRLARFEPRQPPQPRVDGGGIGASKKKTGFDSLPREARQAFERQMKKGMFKNTAEDKEFFYDAYVNG